MNNRFRLLVCLVVLLVPLTVTARADLLFTLDNPNQVILKGQTTVLHFTGSFTNTFDYDLGGPEAGATIATLDKYPGTWFSAWPEMSLSYPFTLKAGQTYRGDIFTVTPKGTDGLGRYKGNYRIIYDDTYYGGPWAQSQQLDFSITVVPEPGTLVGLMMGLGGLGTLGWRRRF